MNPRGPLTAADCVTLVGYGLGIWWSVGGPTWSGLASIACDELDGPIARKTGTTGPQGAALDWGADIALTPLALMRFGRTVGHPQMALAASPLVLAVQSSMVARGVSPVVGSARALVMLATIGIEQYRKHKGLPPRKNPARERRRERGLARR